jgi:hypothetical protein
VFFYSITMATTPYRQPTATGTPGTPIGSVRFFGTAVAGIDNIAPYQSTPLRTPGTYSITAIPYNQPGASGIPGSGFSSNLVLVNQTPTPTFIPSLTPSPTAPFCPAGFTGDAQALSDCPTPTPCTIPQTSTLDTFGITLENIWTPQEAQEILTGTRLTARALCLQGAGGGDVVMAFHMVLQGTNDFGQPRQIKFSRLAQQDSPVCITAKTPEGDQFSANIQCAPNVVMTQYTAVHEYGHVLVGRTEGLYLARIESPNGPGQALFNSESLFVMGPRQLNTEQGTLSDWQRSDYVLDNGWGSAAQWNPSQYDEYPAPAVPQPTPTGFPIRIPRIGPCGDGAPIGLPPLNRTPYPLQQNPCTFSDGMAASPTGLVTEIEEAAADMFLNWVYWRNNPDEGFQDLRWRYQSYTSGTICNPSTGCSDLGLSGQARSTWMNQTMRDLFNEFNW